MEHPSYNVNHGVQKPGEGHENNKGANQPACPPLLFVSEVNNITAKNLLYIETHASDWLLRLSTLGFILFGHASAVTGFLSMMFILYASNILL